jgi:transposase, IS30 family
MKYEQLTHEKRYQIYAHSKANWTQRDMVVELKVHRTTIYREKMRNKGLRGYRPDQAHKLAQERKQYSKKQVKLTPYAKFIIAEKVRLEWSPEQISGFFKRHQLLNISHQTIYTLIREDQRHGGSLHKHLGPVEFLKI